MHDVSTKDRIALLAMQRELAAGRITPEQALALVCVILNRVKG